LNSNLLYVLAALTALAVTAVMIARGWHRVITSAADQPFSHELTLLMVLLWFIVPIATTFVLAQVSRSLFSNRYLFVVLPWLCLLVAAAVSSVRPRILALVAALAIVLVSAMSARVYYWSPPTEDWRTAVSWIDHRFAAGDGLVCFQNPDCQISVSYYLYADRSPAAFTPDTPVSSPGTPTDPRTLRPVTMRQ